MKFWRYIFPNGKKPETATERLTIKDRLTALGNIPQFLKLVYKTSPKLTIITAAFRLVQAVIPIGILYVGKLIIDQIVTITNSGTKVIPAQLWQLVAIEFGLIVLVDILGRAVNLVDNLLGDLFANHTSIEIISHAATLDLDQFEDSSFYDKLERARQQSMGRTVLMTQVLSQIQDLVSIAIFGAGLVAFNPWFILLLVVAVVPSFVVEYYFNGKAYQLVRSQMHRRRELDYIRYVGASDVTAKEMRIFGLSDFFVNMFRRISTQLYTDTRYLALKRFRWGSLLGLVGSACYYTAFVYIILGVVQGALSIGHLTFLFGSLRQLGSLLQAVVIRFNAIAQGAIYLRDFFEFFTIQPKIKVTANPRPFPKPIKHGFTFENVSFKYTASERWANRNLNFTLHANEKIALVGENGAGKTTLVKLLTRLYDPTEGRILLDGYDLREYDLTELRMQIGVIFQDFLHYHMTSSQNIAVGNIKEKDNREQIRASAKKSFADAVIEKLPNKYDQVLGRFFEKGIELSGGEWQKIALARAYMRDAQLMILDEPTSALDARSEYEVFEHFSDLTKGKLAVLVSHRFSTVRMADRIFVLENGQIIEMGNHDELLKTGGRYARLFQLQASGYQ